MDTRQSRDTDFYSIDRGGKSGALLARLLIYFLLISTPLPKGSVQGWAITFMHMITLIALTAFLIERAFLWKGNWIKSPLNKPIAALFFLCVASTFTSVHRGLSFWAVLEFVNYITIYFLVIQVFTRRKHLQTLLFVIAGVAMFLAVFGLFKQAGANPFPWWNYGDPPGPHPFLTSTYVNHNHIAGHLEMAIPVVLGLIASGFKKGRIILLWIILTVLTTALLLSLSRGGWIGALAGSAFFALALLYSKKRVGIKGGLVVSLAAIFLIGLLTLSSITAVERLLTFEQKEKIGTFQDRVTVWKGALELIRDYPLLGSGPGTFSTVYTQYQPPGFWVRFHKAHNDYLQFTAEVGLLWIPVFFWGLFSLFRAGFRKLKNPSRFIRGTTAGALAGFVSILVHSVSDFNLHIPANALLFTVLAAVAALPAEKPDA